MKARVKRIYLILAEEFALFSIELLIVLALSIVSVVTFLWFTSNLLDGELEGFDNAAYAALGNWRGEFFDGIMRGATFLGNRQFIIWPCILLLVYFLFIRPHRWYSITVPVVALGSIGMNVALKIFFDRPRPSVEHMVEATGFSFPSGHAMFAFSFYGLLLYVVWRYSKRAWIKYTGSILLFILILLIGISRVYLGVHYASDVLAGFSAGLIWLVISIAAIKKIQNFIKHRQEAKVKKLESDPH